MLIGPWAVAPIRKERLQTHGCITPMARSAGIIARGRQAAQTFKAIRAREWQGAVEAVGAGTHRSGIFSRLEGKLSAYLDAPYSTYLCSCCGMSHPTKNCPTLEPEVRRSQKRGTLRSRGAGQAFEPPRHCWFRAVPHGRLQSAQHAAAKAFKCACAGVPDQMLG